VLNGPQYLQSVNDGRRLFYNGELVEDPVHHPMLAAAFKNAAAGYDHVYKPEEPHWFRMPHSVEDLRKLLHDLSGWDDLTSVTLSGMMALVTAGARMSTKPEYAHYVDRIQNYQQYCLENDLRCVEAITDAKGDRRLPPSKQDDPDLYLRIVGRRSDGAVINGAKLHITAAATAHELIVMPTKAMKVGEEDWAVACAVPLNAPGVTVVNTTYAPRKTDEDYWPASSRHNSPEGFILFDNVFVPNERVFLAGEIEHSATFAHSLGLWERLGGTAHMIVLADTLVGLAQLIAEANGVDKIPHIKDKIAEMAIYATLIRAGLDAAVSNSETTPQGWIHPSELYTNAARHYAGAEFHLMVRHLHDIAGGGVLTAPTLADLQSSETGAALAKYMRGREGVDAPYRTRLFHTIRDYTADAMGGWHMVTQLQSGGGLYAQRLVTVKHYPMAAAKKLALELANFPTEGESTR
jgi:4-hydroxybutyryl-CoA dehydratase / vinylacetyl-CoA-Delta-isomerase